MVSAVSLGAGLGCVIAVHALLIATVVSPLPVRDPGGLIALLSDATDPPTDRFTYGRYHDLLRYEELRPVTAAGFEKAVIESSVGVDFAVAAFVDSNYFEVIDPAFHIGSVRDSSFHGLLAVVPYEFAMQRRAGLGSRIRVGAALVTVIGVLKRGFHGTTLSAVPMVYLPLESAETALGTATNYLQRPGQEESPRSWLHIYCRPRDPAALFNPTKPQAERPEGMTDIAFLPAVEAVLPAAAQHQCKRFAAVIGVAAALLFVVCSLTAGFVLLMRAQARRKELAIRIALGGTVPQAVVGVAIEAACLAGLASLAAIPAAHGVLRILSGFDLPGGVRLGLLEVRLTAGSLVVAAVMASLFVILSVGVAARAVSASLGGLWHDSNVDQPQAFGYRSRQAMLMVHVASTVFVLGATSLLLTALRTALTVDFGYSPHRTVMAEFDLGRQGYGVGRADLFTDPLRERLRAQFGPHAVGIATYAGGVTPAGYVRIDGRREHPPSPVLYTAVDSGFFSAMDVGPLKGRLFTQDEVRGSGALVGVVSASLARVVNPNGDPLGHTIRLGDGALITIVGTVPDLVYSVTKVTPLDLYLTHGQHARWLGGQRTVVVRTTKAAFGTAAIKAAVVETDSRVVADVVASAADRINQQLALQRLGSFLMAVLGVVGVALTCVSITALMSHLMGARQRELAIRSALGATLPSLWSALAREVLAAVMLGIILGTALCLLAAQASSTFVFGLPERRASLFGAVAAFVLTLAMAATVPFALKLGRTNPASVLRDM